MEKKNEKEGCRMLKIDLITGFLGAGKTTFLKKYHGEGAEYWNTGE